MTAVLSGGSTGNDAERSLDGSAVTLSGVSKVYGRGPTAVHALDNVSLDVARGEFVCLVGASGCG
ncbi:MAG: transporter, ATPase subunit [Dactylosporangium sp.]|nr:transporter, ATPase subunit [Dactylosporangium sp.]